MNRTTKLILIAAIAEMALLAAALIAWKGWAATGFNSPHLRHGVVQLVFFPAWLAVCAAYLSRRLTSDRPRISDSHRRYINTGLAVTSLAMAGLHGIVAYSFATGWSPDRLTFVRLVTDEGFSVTTNRTAFDLARLAGTDILLITNPNGAGAAAPVEQRAGAAFADAEVDAVQQWVAAGGALLLVTDHYPAGASARSLAERTRRWVHLLHPTPRSLRHRRRGVLRCRRVPWRSCAASPRTRSTPGRTPIPPPAR